MDAAKRTCSIDGCDKPHMARGWCGTHYSRWRVHGDPLATPRRQDWTLRHKMPSGYIRVWCPGHPAATADGYALEHRKVWFDAHGSLPSGHHVHHINHDKSDNRLANLELISASAHVRGHVEAQGTVENQFGIWPIRSAAERANKPRRPRPCVQCGVTFTPEKRAGKPSPRCLDCRGLPGRWRDGHYWPNQKQRAAWSTAGGC